MARELESTADIHAALRAAKTIAVLGAHPDESRPASYVPAYLKKVGYRVLPVNPRFEGQAIFGEAAQARLDQIGEPVDIVDVFRRSADVPAHLEEILAMKPLPKLVWLQQGIRHDETARALVAAGIDVVQDRCTLAEHRRMGAA